MLPVIDGYLEPRFRSKNKKKKFGSPLSIVICFAHLLKNKVEKENE